jgi:hypothetical protein
VIKMAHLMPTGCSSSPTSRMEPTSPPRTKTVSATSRHSRARPSMRCEPRGVDATGAALVRPDGHAVEGGFGAWTLSAEGGAGDNLDSPVAVAARIERATGGVARCQKRRGAGNRTLPEHSTSRFALRGSKTRFMLRLGGIRGSVRRARRGG